MWGQLGPTIQLILPHSIECAACGRASGRRLQLERPAAPAAACTCPAREVASAIARALPSFVCVRSWRENQK
eukprot:scaffold14181_cov121-Isochrysis_galbana.AAC.1